MTIKKRTQILGVLTGIGGIVNLVIKFLQGEPITMTDIGAVTAGAVAYTLGEKVDRKNGG